MKNSVGIIDIGFGNVSPLVTILDRLFVNSILIREPEYVKTCDKLIIPGIGAFDNFMRCLRKKNMDQPIKDFAKTGKYLLGICIGAQILGNSSEEGAEKGLSLLPMVVKSLKDIASDQRIPHMGWNTLSPLKDHPLLGKLTDSARFYFAHSYYLCPEHADFAVAVSCYGKSFSSVVAFNNVLGVQFHPEKSHKHGVKILENFCTL